MFEASLSILENEGPQALMRSGQGHVLDEQMQQQGMRLLLGSELTQIEAFVLARAGSQRCPQSGAAAR